MSSEGRANRMTRWITVVQDSSKVSDLSNRRIELPFPEKGEILGGVDWQGRFRIQFVNYQILK